MIRDSQYQDTKTGKTVYKTVTAKEKAGLLVFSSLLKLSEYWTESTDAEYAAMTDKEKEKVEVALNKLIENIIYIHGLN